MRRLWLMLILAACAATPQATTIAPTTTISLSIPPSTSAPVVECEAIPYNVGILPDNVSGESVDKALLELDPLTSLGGTRSLIWVDATGQVVVALVRGTLPLEQFPGDKGKVLIAGTEGVAGPFDDGRWMVAWFEPPGDRCDLYTMVFYPPVEPSTVEATIKSITRGQG